MRDIDKNPRIQMLRRAANYVHIGQSISTGLFETRKESAVYWTAEARQDLHCIKQSFILNLWLESNLNLSSRWSPFEPKRTSSRKKRTSSGTRARTTSWTRTASVSTTTYWTLPSANSTANSTRNSRFWSSCRSRIIKRTRFLWWETQM